MINDSDDQKMENNNKSNEVDQLDKNKKRFVMIKLSLSILGLLIAGFCYFF